MTFFSASWFGTKLKVSGHSRLPGSESERAGSETLGHIRGEYLVSRGSAGAEGPERLPFMEQNQERKAVYSKRQGSAGLTTLDFTIFHTPQVWQSELVMRLTQLPFSEC